MAKISAYIRSAVLAAIVIIVSFMCGLRLLQIQIADGEKYLALTKQTHTADQPIEAARGKIADCNGVVLNTNTLSYSINLQRASLLEGTENEIIYRVLTVLLKNGEEWNESLPISKTAPYKFLDDMDDEIDTLRKCRAEMSDGLQKWIFRQYVVHNAAGEERSIYDIFDMEYLIPPGGTGECAAPKLLEYAYRHGLKPVAMGEFWYGTSPETAVRTHGHFYPSCTSKCGPLLGYMLQGMELMKLEEIHGTPSVIYEDKDICSTQCVQKPATGRFHSYGFDSRLRRKINAQTPKGPVKNALPAPESICIDLLLCGEDQYR